MEKTHKEFNNNNLLNNQPNNSNNDVARKCTSQVVQSTAQLNTLDYSHRK